MCMFGMCHEIIKDIKNFSVPCVALAYALRSLL